MASLEQRNGRYRVVFRYAGEKYAQSLKTASEKAANASLARLEDNLRRVELGTLSVPDNADLPTFLLSDGRRNGQPKTQRIRFLSKLLDAFLDQIPPNSIEENSRWLIKTHVGHLKRVFGVRLGTPGPRAHPARLHEFIRSLDRAEVAPSYAGQIRPT